MRLRDYTLRGSLCRWPETDGGPNVTAITHASGAVHLRCFVEFLDVVRTNAHVTWLDADGKPMPLLRATAVAATIESPGCSSAKRRRRRRRRRRRKKRDGEKYKCRVRWDRPKPHIPDQVYRDFLTLAASRSPPLFELCVATDPCAKSKSYIGCPQNDHPLL